MTDQNNAAQPAMQELKPCPFCGGPVELEKTIGGRSWWGVVCRNTRNRGGTCAVQIVPSASKEAAIERWNMRAPVADERAAAPGPWVAERPRNRSALIVWRWCQPGSASMRREYLRADGKIASTPGRFRSLNEAHAAIDRAALASAPVAGEAQPVAWAFNRPGHDYKFFTTDPDADNLDRDKLIPLYAAPQVSEAEPIAWESTTPAYIKFITDSRYRKFSPAVRKWYQPYRCASCAALSAQPGAQKEQSDAN